MAIAPAKANVPTINVLAPELKEMIYAPLLDWSSADRTPALFYSTGWHHAMREELVAIFQRVNRVLILNETNNWSVDGLPDDVLLKVKHIKIVVK
jgi:hypothetical protein